MPRTYFNRVDSAAGWEAADFGLTVFDGDPDVRVSMTYDGEATGSGPTVGFARVGRSRFEVTLTADESIHVIEGDATIEVDGASRVELSPGVAAFFPRGAVCRWTVREPVLEFFALSS